jgi:hypothetical protein
MAFVDISEDQKRREAFQYRNKSAELSEGLVNVFKGISDIAAIRKEAFQKADAEQKADNLKRLELRMKLGEANIPDDESNRLIDEALGPRQAKRMEDLFSIGPITSEEKAIAQRLSQPKEQLAPTQPTPSIGAQEEAQPPMGTFQGAFGQKKRDDRLINEVKALEAQDKKDQLAKPIKDRRSFQEFAAKQEFAKKAKEPEIESGIRKEVGSLPVTKELAVISSALNKIESTAFNPSETGASDLSLIFSYMKILDPNSTVREGEFANAQNSGGVDSTVVNLYNNIKSGQRLSAKQRTDFANQAAQIAEGQLSTYREFTSPQRQAVLTRNLNPDVIFPSDRKIEESIKRISERSKKGSSSQVITREQIIEGAKSRGVDAKVFELTIKNKKDANGNPAFTIQD